MATEALPEAAAHASLPVVAALLGAGADRSAAEDGVSALRMAVRAGRTDATGRLRAAGATDDSTGIDRLDSECTARRPWCEPPHASGCSTDNGVA